MERWIPGKLTVLLFTTNLINHPPLLFCLCLYVFIVVVLQLNFQHWQEGEPNNRNNDESCTEFKMYYRDESGSWNDVNCESYNDWLCQIRAGTTGEHDY